MNFLKLVLLFICCANCASFADDYVVDKGIPSLEDKFEKWRVFTTVRDGKKICYTVSQPGESVGNHKDGRSPYLMVIKFGNTKQEVSVNGGYNFKANSNVSVSIDGTQFRFLAEQESTAWPEKFGADKDVIEQMMKGFKVIAFSESSVGTYAVDSYDLSGFKNAYDKVVSLCN